VEEWERETEEKRVGESEREGWLVGG